jgi:hypothetical protein
MRSRPPRLLGKSPGGGYGRFAGFSLCTARGNFAFAFMNGRRVSPTIARCKLRSSPFAKLLHMSGIGLRQRTMQAVFGSMGIDPLPHFALFTLRACDVDGSAVTVAPRPAAAAMQ